LINNIVLHSLECTLGAAVGGFSRDHHQNNFIVQLTHSADNGVSWLSSSSKLEFSRGCSIQLQVSLPSHGFLRVFLSGLHLNRGWCVFITRFGC